MIFRLITIENHQKRAENAGNHSDAEE